MCCLLLIKKIPWSFCYKLSVWTLPVITLHSTRNSVITVLKVNFWRPHVLTPVQVFTESRPMVVWGCLNTPAAPVRLSCPCPQPAAHWLFTHSLPSVDLYSILLSHFSHQLPAGVPCPLLSTSTSWQSYTSVQMGFWPKHFVQELRGKVTPVLRRGAKRKKTKSHTAAVTFTHSNSFYVEMV